MTWTEIGFSEKPASQMFVVYGGGQEQNEELNALIVYALVLFWRHKQMYEGFGLKILLYFVHLALK